jgi:hypothetical protein
MAMIALREAVFPSEKDIFAALARQWPDVPPPQEQARRGSAVTFQLGGERGALSFVPSPIPWENLKGPCATAWYWPQAAEAMKAHRAHVIAGLGGGPADAVTRRLRLTALTGAVASAAGPAACGILWPGGMVVHAPEPFLDRAREMSRGNLPLELWIDFRIFRESEDTLTLFTTGLAEFGLPDLEIPRSRRPFKEVYAAAFNTAHYLIDQGPVLKDGDTLGLAAGETVLVHHVESRWGHGRTILSVRY